MNNNPIIAENKPLKVTLEKGNKYYFSTCGKSRNQPFCDGSHKGIAFKPESFTAEESGDAYLCACKHTHNTPFCDGTYKKFTKEQIGVAGSWIESLTTPLPHAVTTPEEPTVPFIHDLARNVLSKMGHHGPMTSMGVPRGELPHWDDIQIMVAQMSKQPLMEDVGVGTELIIGSEAKKPLRLEIPLFVSDMSFGSLSEEANVALATGAELAGTGICSGEGGMLPEEQEANSRYFYELASAQFDYREEL